MTKSAPGLPFLLSFSLVLIGLLPTSGAFAQAFDIQQSLEVNRILEQPRLSPDGGKVAFLSGDWQEDAAIKSPRPTGKLVIRSVEGVDIAELSRHASNPVWSPGGEYIAFFEDEAEQRLLVVRKAGGEDSEPVHFAVPGEPARYSGQSFPPVWGALAQTIITAEAVESLEPPEVTGPYSVTTATTQLPNDAHFRPSRLWRIVRLDLAGQTKSYLTPPLALRDMTPNADGSRLLLKIALPDQPGFFLGDEFTLPTQYQLLSLASGKGPQPLGEKKLNAVLGWTDGDTLLVRDSTGLATIDAETLKSSSLGEWPVAHSNRGHSLFGAHLAIWGKAPAKSVQKYLIPPPSPDIMSVMRLGTNGMTTVVAATDQQEIVQALWLQDPARLLIHTRDLDSFDESLILWERSGTRTLLSTAASFGPIAGAADGSVLAFSLEKADALPELQIFDVEKQQLTSISALNRQLMGAVMGQGHFSKPRIIGGSGPEGTPWRAFLYLPGDSKPGQAPPLVVTAYGRLTDQLNRFHAEAQMHTARGYAYLMPDVYPLRGALHRAYAEVIPSAIAFVHSQYDVAPQTGFYGGSLGGYAGLVLLTRSTSVDAAVLRAAPSEFAMSWATGKDRDADLLEYLMKNTTPFQNMDGYLEDSPFWMADRVTAATLLLHGTDDAQVPLEQSEWMFQGIRRTGKATAELRIYPEADHSIVRGNAAYYLDYYKQLFAWWEQHLHTH